MSTGLECHALVIGINDYSGGISPLRSAVRDATAIAGILESEHKYSVTCLCDGDAVRSSIEKYLTETLPPRLSPENGFLLYFAGHGVAIGDGTEGPQGYLLPQDSKPSDEASWLSMETLRAALDALPCRHLLIVLDCCFAGSFRWASSRAISSINKALYTSQFERFLKGDAWQALTSASHDELAADLSPGRDNNRDSDGLDEHSPFAAALIRGLSGAADSSRAGFEPDGVITATELYQYVFEELVPQGVKTKQTPGIWPLKADNMGEFVFLNPNAQLNTVPDPPLDDENNPWLGLEAYSSGDTNLFFGRQRVIDDLLERVLDPNTGSLLAVVGASGTGKSSVVKAGLLPLLADPPDDLKEKIGQWTVITAPRLRAEPGQQLDQVLKDLDKVASGRKAIVLYDQFEELYTQCPDNDARTDFLQRLRELIDKDDGPVTLITLRSDFEPRPKASEALADLWARDETRFVVPAFSQEEMREVIEGPANVKALFFEPIDLVGKLLDEIVAMPGALPLLSFALAEMYRQAQLRRRNSGSADRALTTEDYKETGGVVGALHKRATLLFDEADDDRRQTIQRVFLRMLSQEGARLTRRRVNMAELGFGDADEQARVDSVVKQFVDARLLVIDGEFVEPAHDTLVVAWEKLQEWLASAGSQEMVRSVWRDASQWQAHRHDKSASGYLWNNDPRLPQMEAISPELNRLEQDFVSTSVRKKKRQRNWTFGITGSVILILVAATLFSYQQSVEAKRQLAFSDWKAGITARDDKNEAVRAAHLFARSASNAGSSLENASRLAAKLAADRVTLHTYYQANDKVDIFELNPDQSRLLSVDTQGVLRQLDFETGGLIEHSVIDHPGLLRAGYSPDGSRIMTLGNDSLRLWDANSGEPVNIKRIEHEHLDQASFSSDGSRILTIGRDHTLHLWDANTGELVFSPPLFNYDLFDWTANQVSSRFLGRTEEGKAILWREDSGVVIPPIRMPYTDQEGGQLDATGQKLLSWSSGGSISMIDEITREQVRTRPMQYTLNEADTVMEMVFTAQQVTQSLDEEPIDEPEEFIAPTRSQAVWTMRFSANQDQIHAHNLDGVVVVLDATTGARIFERIPDLRSIQPIQVFSPEEDHVLIWGAQQQSDSGQLWDVKTQQPVFATPLRHGDLVKGAEVYWAYERILSWGADDTVRLWSLRSGRLFWPPIQHHGVSGAILSDNRQHIWSWGAGSVRLWDARSGEPVTGVQLPHSLVDTVQVSRDGTRVVSTSFDNSVRLWGVQANEFANLRWGDLGGVELSADESHLLIHDRNKAWLLSSTTGYAVQPRPLQHDTQVAMAEFAHGGERVLTEDIDDNFRLWNVFDHNPVPGKPQKLDEKYTTRVDPDGSQWYPFKIINPEGNRLITMGEQAALWQISDAGELTLISLIAHEEVEHAAFNKDGSSVLTMSLDHTVQLWDGKTGEKLLLDAIRPGQGPDYAMWMQDGRHILTVSDHTIQKWDMHGNEIFSPRLRHDRVSGAVHAGRRILSWGNDAIQIWDADTGTPLLDTPISQVGLEEARISDDGTRVLAWTSEDTIRLWNVGSRTAVIAASLQHPDLIEAEYSQDGSLVLSRGTDGIVRLWHANTGDPLIEATLPRSAVVRARFYANDTRILAWGRQSIKSFSIDHDTNISTRDLRKDIEVRTGTCLTDAGTLRHLTVAEWHLKKSPGSKPGCIFGQ